MTEETGREKREVGEVKKELEKEENLWREKKTLAKETTAPGFTTKMTPRL